MDSEDKGNIGIDKLSIAIRTMGYKFRRQLESDYGIDAHIEIRENEQYCNKLSNLVGADGVIFSGNRLCVRV